MPFTLSQFPEKSLERLNPLHRNLNEFPYVVLALSGDVLLSRTAQFLRLSFRSIVLCNPRGKKHVFLPRTMQKIPPCPNWTVHFASTVIESPSYLLEPYDRLRPGSALLSKTIQMFPTSPLLPSSHRSHKLHRHAQLTLFCLFLHFSQKMCKHA